MTTRSLAYTQELPADLPSEAWVLSRARLENFTVASRLLPGPVRDHLMAFYGFARFVDEIGDSYPGDRLAALDWVEAETGRALAGVGSPAFPLVARAVAASRSVGLEPDPLFRLVAANRQDQTVSSYETFDDLLGYCALSANPVGDLVLGALGAVSPETSRLSALICTGLQLAEHWQDAAEDACAGRVYLPGEDLHRFGIDPDELRGGPPARPELKALMLFEAARARKLLNDGEALIGLIPGRLRWAVAGFWAGGQAALDGLAARDFDPLLGPPARSRAGTGRHLFAALRRSNATREAR